MMTLFDKRGVSTSETLCSLLTLTRRIRLLTLVLRFIRTTKQQEKNAFQTKSVSELDLVRLIINKKLPTFDYSIEVQK